MKRFYISHPNIKKLDEIQEEEFYSLVGNKNIHFYVNEVYHEIISLEDVPEEYRNEVQSCVSNRTARFGEYQSKATEEDLYNALAELGVSDESN